jgi:endoglucanase
MRLSGLSWFGGETPDMAPNGLWVHDLNFYMDLMAREKINVIRVPFSAELALYHWDDQPSQGFVSASPRHQNKKAMDILDDLFDQAHSRGMLILLDLHRLNNQYISELHYDPDNSRFTAETFIQTWFKILDRYHDHPALWGIDLLNEPHGRATVNDGNPNTDWKMAAEDAIRKIEDRFPKANWIYLVEGVEWGKQLSGFTQGLIQPPSSAKHRIAYSAHNYGRSVVPSTNIWDVNGLHQDWDNHFGLLREQGQAVIIGDWGGRTDLDSDWMNVFVDYLRDRNMTNTFFWSLGPNSGDVAGFLQDDWTSVDEFKRTAVHRLQPNPFPAPHAAPPQKKMF